MSRIVFPTKSTPIQSPRCYVNLSKKLGGSIFRPPFLREHEDERERERELQHEVQVPVPCADFISVGAVIVAVIVTFFIMSCFT